ncbi:MAG: ATP-binding protein [Candidatus Aminicenantes bacterium]|nr:ATP-binding protein [Candidatus Aminicenantes bacterium]
MSDKREETIKKWKIDGNPFFVLPPDIGDHKKLNQVFTGRESEVKRVCSLIIPPKGIFIHGMYGVGKTILIHKILRQLDLKNIISVYTSLDPYDGFRKTVLKGLSRTLANKGIEEAKLVAETLSIGTKTVSKKEKKGRKSGLNLKIIKGSRNNVKEFIETTTLEIKNPREFIEKLIRIAKDMGKTVVIAVDDLERRSDISSIQQIIDDSRDIISFGGSLILTGHPVGVTKDLRTSSGGLFFEIPLEQLNKEELIKMMINYLNTMRSADFGTQPFDIKAAEYIANYSVINNLTPRLFNIACSHIFEQAAIECCKIIDMKFLKKQWSMIADKILQNIEKKDMEYLKILYDYGRISEDSDEAIVKIGGVHAEIQEVRNILLPLIQRDIFIEREVDQKRVIELNPHIKDNPNLFLE